jgi:hypothetical protein
LFKPKILILHKLFLKNNCSISAKKGESDLITLYSLPGGPRYINYDLQLATDEALLFQSVFKSTETLGKNGWPANMAFSLTWTNDCYLQCKTIKQVGVSFKEITWWQWRPMVVPGGYNFADNSPHLLTVTKNNGFIVRNKYNVVISTGYMQSDVNQTETVLITFNENTGDLAIQKMINNNGSYTYPIVKKITRPAGLALTADATTALVT